MLIQINDFMVVDYSGQSETRHSSYGNQGSYGNEIGYCNGRHHQCSNGNKTIGGNGVGGVNTPSNVPLITSKTDDEEMSVLENVIDAENQKTIMGEIHEIDLKKLEEIKNKAKKKKEFLDSMDDDYDYHEEAINNNVYTNVYVVKQRNEFLRRLEMFIMTSRKRTYQDMAQAYGDSFTNRAVGLLQEEGFIYFNEDREVVIAEEFIIKDMTEIEKNYYYEEYQRLI